MGTALVGLVSFIGIGIAIYGLFLLIFRKGKRIRGITILVVSPVLAGVVIAIIEPKAAKIERQLAAERKVKEEEKAIAEKKVRDAAEEKIKLAEEAEKKVRDAAEEKIKLAEEHEKEQKCMADLQCWGDKNGLQASFACDDSVSKLARYTYEWTDGVLESKFSRFRWNNKDRSFLTYIGDKIRFQNGFGAWQDMIYECDYDPSTKAVMDVRARPGRL